MFFFSLSSDIRLFMQDTVDPDGNLSKTLVPKKGLLSLPSCSWDSPPLPMGPGVPISSGWRHLPLPQWCCRYAWLQLQLPEQTSVSSSSPERTLGHMSQLAPPCLQPSLLDRLWTHIAAWSPAWSGAPPLLLTGSQPCLLCPDPVGLYPSLRSWQALGLP